MNLHFQTFRLQPPHAPPSSGDTPCSGRAWPPIRIGLLSAVLRTSLIPSSLVSRIRPNRVCVAAHNGPLFYGLSVHLRLLSTPCRHDAVTFGYWREAPPERDFHPLMHAHSQAHWGASIRARREPRLRLGRWFQSGLLARRMAPAWPARRRARSDAPYRRRDASAGFMVVLGN